MLFTSRSAPFREGLPGEEAAHAHRADVETLALQRDDRFSFGSNAERVSQFLSG